METNVGMDIGNTADAPEPNKEGEAVTSAEWEKQRLLSKNIIRNYTLLTMGVGLIPVPVVDVVAIAALEIKMISELASAYGFPFPRRLVIFKLLISLVGSIGPVYLSIRIRSVLKGMPLVGHALFLGAVSVSSGAVMYAIGKLFQKHFESGGTFLSGENPTIKQYFRDRYEEGKRKVPLMMDLRPA